MGAVDSRQSAHLTPWQDPVNSPHQETSQVPTSAKQKADSAQPDLPVPNVERVDKSQATPDDSHQSNDSGSSSSSSSDEDSSSDDGSSSDSNDKRPASALLANSHTAVSDVLGANSASASQQHSRQSRPNSALNLASVSEALKQKLGYTLHVRPSGIAHAEAGQGLWLEGRAPVGAVVALYPGLVYSPIHYR